MPAHNERRNRYCKKCEKETMQEYVLHMATHYWRCEKCLQKAIVDKGIFHPLTLNYNYCRFNPILNIRRIRELKSNKT